MRVWLYLLLLTPTLPAFALEAGAAKSDLTPPLDTPLNGYFDRLGRGAVAVHDPLSARALYLADDKTAVVLVATDLCVINRELRGRVLELLPGEINKDNVILTATHTHSGQGGMAQSLLFRSVSGRYMPEILEFTAQRIVEAIQAALANRKRATVGFDVIAQDGLTENRQVPGGPVDPQIGVIRVDDSDGNPIAIIANMAAHPTTVGGDDRLSISADYLGYFYAAVEAAVGEGCVAMFLNGAEGNQRPANPQQLAGWAHTEWVGQQLAAKTMEAATKITGGEASLRVATSTPRLPATIADSFLPADTVLKTLEINDLLLSFVPGEACVELGLELRRRALARGYKAHFTVGLANDHIMYIVPRELYPTMTYECGMHFYGPGMDRWVYREFDALMSKGDAPKEQDVPPDAAAKSVDNGAALQLRGSHYAIGYQHGSAMKDALRAAFDTTIMRPCDDGAWIPNEGWWTYAPPFLRLTPLALPRLGIGARPMLAGLSNETLDTLEGIAAGAQLPFDAVWLLQCAPTLTARASVAEMYRAPFCTMLAITGERAGVDQIIVGRNLDWPHPEPPLLVEVIPDRGMRYAQVGFAWSAGTYTGMNEAGLVLAVERVESLGEPSLNGPPVEFVLHEALIHDRSVAEVLARLEAAPHLRGYHVLIADPGPENARLVELGETRVTRVASNGVLLGRAHGFATDAESGARYARVDQLVRSERMIDSDELAKILNDAEPGRSGREQIRNEFTRHSVVFEPRYRRMIVAFPGADGKLGQPVTVTLRKNTQ